MNKANNMTRLMERYLVSSMLTDMNFRNQVLSMVRDQSHALAPELGLNIKQLAQIGLLIEARTRKYQRYIGIVVWLTLIVIGGLWIAEQFVDGVILPYSWWVLPVISAWAVIAIFRFHKHYTDRAQLSMNHSFSTTSVERTLRSMGDHNEELRELPNASQNVVVYSGFTPFVGAGQELAGWSFPVNVSRPVEEFGNQSEITPFTLSELYDSVEHDLGMLGLKGLESTDFLFVNGTQVRTVSWLLPDETKPPISTVDRATVRKYMDQNDPIIRHYRWIRVFEWADELVVSYLLRFSIQGEHLFVEVNRYLLGPLEKKYRAIDELVEDEEGPGTVIARVVGYSLAAIVSVPFVAIGDGLWMLDAGVKKLTANRIENRRLKKIKNSPHYDYGAANSLRDQIADGSYARYYQKLDTDMIVKVLERQILESLVRFLDEHNIDSSDIESRQATILNRGVIVKGGELETQSLAVGANASASVRQTLRERVRGLTEAPS